MKNKRYFFVIDFETGGLDPQKHDPVQVAVQVLDPQTLRPVSSFVSYIKPDPSRVSPEALAIHGISLETLADAPEPCDVFEALVEFLRPYQQGLFVAHNAKFDYEFMTFWAAKCSPEGFKMSHLFDYRLICTAQLAFQQLVLREQVTPRVKLTELAEHFNLEHNAHDALGDVVVTAEILRICLKSSLWFKLQRGLKLVVREKRLSAFLESVQSLY